MPKERPPVTETYLGDGLYASTDGYMIILRAPRSDGDHIVALEPVVMRELLRFARDIGMLQAVLPML